MDDSLTSAARVYRRSDSDAILHEPPVAGDEVTTLLGSLERQRRTFAWKCGGLDAAGQRATPGPSAVTLGGLLKHLAAVEDHQFSVKLHGLATAHRSTPLRGTPTRTGSGTRPPRTARKS
jgi:hypothetical protein